MKYILYCLLLFLTIYSDSPLIQYLGEFGRSPLAIISILLFILFSLGGTRLTHVGFQKNFWKLIKYTYIISLIWILLFPCLGISLNQLGSFIPAKVIRASMYSIGWFCFIAVMITLSKDFSPKRFFRPFLWVFIFQAIFAFLEYQQMPYAFLGLHNQAETYYRIRLLTSESSWTAPQLCIFFLMSLYYTMNVRKNKYLTLLVVCLMLYQISITGSKNLLASLFVGAAVGMYGTIIGILKKGFSLKSVFVILIAIVGVHYLMTDISENLTNSIQSDLENATSIATRQTSIIAAYLIGSFIPVGTGFGSYLYFLPIGIKAVMPYMPKVFDFTELEYYLNSGNDQALAAKSMLSQYTMYWGILGTIFFVKILVALYKQSTRDMDSYKKNIIRTAFVVILVQISTSSDFDYSMWAFVCVMLWLSYQNVIKQGTRT